MNVELKKNKEILRTFMRAKYNDERLVMLLDHARAGNLAYDSCCCFVGIPTSDHSLRGLASIGSTHYQQFQNEITSATDHAYFCLADHIRGDKDRYQPVVDMQRRRIVIPMILAEMKRRNQAPRSEQTKKNFEFSNE